MIIEFSMKNFRSIKDEITLSMEASGAKGKPDNVFEIKTKAGKKFRLLKTAVIYGPNASGKSNIIRGFWSFRQLINNSFRHDANEELNVAEPFELDTETVSLPTIFKLTFIAWDKQQYIYSISISKTKGVIEETLKYYPGKNSKLIFKRKGRKITFKNSDFFKTVNVNESINPKRLFLSEIGNSGIKYWEDLRNYFIIGNSILNTSSKGMVQRMTELAKKIFENDDSTAEIIKSKVVKLIKLSDLGITGLSLEEEEAEISKENNVQNLEDESYSEIRKIKKFKTYHNVFTNKNISGVKQFDLIKQGSAGTNGLVGIGTEIMMSLEFKYGRPIWIDEIDNSLHPYLCRFIINLFNHPNSNKHNSQLIVATHETTLLDKNNFRKDQIWITSKDKYGVTKLYSVYDLDIDGLRDDIPFDKWYMSGKFGGIPSIKELDFIFERT